MRRRTFISACIGTTVGGLAGLAYRHANVAPGSPLRGAADPSGARLYSATDTAFGTTITARVRHKDQRQAELAIEDAFGAARKVDALMSIHSETSQVFRLNRDGRLRDPDPHLLEVLRRAQTISTLTNGAFDITVQPLWSAFSRSAANHTLPSDQEIAMARQLVNWKHLLAGPRQLSFRKAGMAITLNGIAQGYAVDLALAALKARGVEHALLDTGEYVSNGARAPGHPWLLGVQDPRHADACAGTLRLDGRSVATSGDYETMFTPDFVNHHIFDPDTGHSPLELASVTVVAPTGWQADGLSTALMVLGPDKAMALAAELADVDVLLVGKTGKIWTTPNLPALRT